VRPLDPFVHWLARARAPIQTKLLVSLGVLAVLLTALGVIGLVALGQANARAERLVELQLRTAAYRDLSRATTTQLYALTEVIASAERLDRLTNELVNRADAEVAQGVGDTRDAYFRSQLIVLGFAGASLVFALLLGLAIALSIIGPLRAIGVRVARIAEGDFGGQLRVENRDELGTLAANVDRMGEQLGVLYEQQGMRAADEERLRLARDLHD